jgi:hypothetical protein
MTKALKQMNKKIKSIKRLASIATSEFKVYVLDKKLFIIR